MAPDTEGSSYSHRQAHHAAVTPRFAAALAMALIGCSGVDAHDGSSASGAAQREQEERGASGVRVDSFAAGSEPVTVDKSFEQCLQRHVEEHGSALAVTALACPGVEGVSCDEPLDITRLASFENLTSLDLSHRCIADVGPLAELGKLERLELRGNRVADIRPLGALRALRSLGLASNPLREPWSYKTKEPFSHWTRLEELNLDGTGATNILPLESLTSLRVLHLNGCSSASIRPLRTLTNLRELHLDDGWFVDLAELEGMTQLEILTANRSLISSIEPLRRLAAKGRLRDVSLDENCIDACETLDVAQLSCADQSSSCGTPPDWTPADAFSVPAASVEQYAPAVELPLWTQDQVDAAFELISASIRWDKPRDGCTGRAEEATALLADSSYPSLTWVYAFGNLRPLTNNHPTGFVAFDWHVTVAVRTEQGYVVLDPALEPRPLALGEWYARLVDSADTDLNFSCRNYYSDLTDTFDNICGENGSIVVDEQGRLTVDELRDVRGTICAAAGCTPM